MLTKTVNLICKIVGHTWRYKDYSNWKDEIGDSYPFKASRNCSICDQFEYLNVKWNTATNKSPYDLEADTQYSKHLLQEINNS